MTIGSKAIKATILMSILFMSMFAIVAPHNTVKAQSGLGFVNLSSIVDVNWTQDTTKIVPRGEPATLNVMVKYNVASGGYFNALSLLAKQLYSGTRANVNLEIISKPDWAEVSLSTNDANFVIGNNLPESRTIQMTISLDEDAPGFLLGSIEIKAKIGTISKLLFPNLQGFEKTFSLKFVPDYLPLVDAQPVDSNQQNIGPMDTAMFPIEIENQGNERTTAFLSVDNVPSGWTAIITDSITLNVEEKATVYLTVQPPRSVGYHYDVETIQVNVEPARATDISNKGEARTVSLQVESRGFSFIGIEYVLIPIILIAAVLLFLFYYYVYKPKKMK